MAATPNYTTVTDLTGVDTLRWFAERGAGFTLLCGPKHDCNSPGKVPHERDWQAKPHTLAEAESHLKRGGNVGQLTSDLLQVDIDSFGDVFLQSFGFEQAPCIVRDKPTRLKIIFRVIEIPAEAGGLKWKFHERAKHPCVELIYKQNAVIAGTHESGETIRLINSEGEIPSLTWAGLVELIDTWLAILRGELLHVAEAQEIPAPAPEFAPEPEPAKSINDAGKAAKIPIKTLDELHQEVEKRWTPLQVFERFGLAANGTQEEKGGWIRVLGNGGLFVKGSGPEQFWSLTGATGGGAKVPGGGAVQAWAWCETGQTRWKVDGKDFVDTIKAMAEAGGIVLPAKLVTRKSEQAQSKSSKNGRAKVDFSELIEPGEAGDDPLRPGSWADLAVIPTTWDWDMWLARGVATILSGESGVGKSIAALRIAGVFINRWSWPDGTPYKGEAGAVLWCEAEAFQQVHRERAENWGMPTEKILTPIAPQGDFSLTNPDHVRALKAAAAWPHVKLIIIDSISGAYPAIEKSTEEAMPVMKWLAALARDNNKPILITHHLRKRGVFDNDTVDLDRLRGASAIAQPARLVWAMDTPDPQAKDNKRLSVIKSNLAKYPLPVGMVITDNGVNFGAAPEKPKIETIAEKAMDLLRSLLESEPQPADLIEHEFDQAGISKATMKRAKAKLGVISTKIGREWMWGLPEGRGYPYEN